MSSAAGAAAVASRCRSRSPRLASSQRPPSGRPQLPLRAAAPATLVGLPAAPTRAEAPWGSPPAAPRREATLPAARAAPGPPRPPCPPRGKRQLGLQPARSSGTPAAPLLVTTNRSTRLEVAAFGAHAAGEPGAGALDVNERRRAYARLASHGPVRDTAIELGITEQAAVQQRTFTSYNRLLSAFMIFCGLTSLVMPAHMLDARIVQFFDYLYLEGRAASSGEKLIAAVMMFLPDYHARGRLPLPRAGRALRGWRRLAPTKTRRPLPWAVCCAVAMQIMAEATVACLPYGPEAALLWIVMVDTYLRPGEALRLMAAQVLGPCGILADVVIHINPDYMLRASKTGEMDETVTISRRWIGVCLRALATTRQGQTLWPMTLPQMKNLFDRAAAKVGLTPLAPVLYMARHSGASIDRQEGRLSLDEVGKRGRWRTLSSVRRYEKRGLLQEVWNNLSERQRQYCESAMAALAAKLAQHFCGNVTARRRTPSGTTSCS